MKQKDRNMLLTLMLGGIIVFAVLLGTDYLQITTTGIVWNPHGGVGGNGNGNGGANGNGDGTGDGDGDGNGDEGPPANPWLHLEIEPQMADRGANLVITVTSNMPGASVSGQVRHQSAPTGWISSLSTVTLDGNGECTIFMTADNAGWWDVQVSSGAVNSNVEALTVRGITIYQEKDVWSVGETYTGAASSTYRNWIVLVFAKNQSEALWDYVAAAYTNEHGILPYGTLTADITSLPPEPLNVIAIIDRNSAEFYEAGEWLDEHQYSGYNDDLDAIPNDIIDRSNILTFTVE